tara:strand:+ start:128 stop:337 length:210 start_codon:yes stop_codon:yes gene_type:complete
VVQVVEEDVASLTWEFLVDLVHMLLNKYIHTKENLHLALHNIQSVLVVVTDVVVVDVVMVEQVADSVVV